jgi:hypothetical protein
MKLQLLRLIDFQSCIQNFTLFNGKEANEQCKVNLFNAEKMQETQKSSKFKLKKMPSKGPNRKLKKQHLGKLERNLPTRSNWNSKRK